ncbi:GIY-YIG nuclease family protein [Lactococcus petauri]|nr:GIY-YIG nuclease family protein [Lactococcus petauri]
MKSSSSGCIGLITFLFMAAIFIKIAPYLLIIAAIILVGYIWIRVSNHKKEIKEENEKVQKLEGYIQTIITENPDINISWETYENSGLNGQVPKSLYLEDILSNIEGQVYDRKQQLELLEEQKRILEEQQRQEKIINQKLDDLASKGNKFSPNEIFEIINSPLTEDFTGIYIITNEDNKKVYVGQAKKVLSRLTQHFQGRGNPDIYADFKYGASQTIQTLSLAHSGYASLDKLEKDYILRYDACANGYNKTVGNRN